MKKTLVCVQNLDEHICQDTHKFYREGKILTASAKDELFRRGIEIVSGPAPEPHKDACWEGCVCCAEADAGTTELPPDLERLVLGVAAVLKEKCGIQDPAQLRELSLQAAKIIKDAL